MSGQNLQLTVGDQNKCYIGQRDNCQLLQDRVKGINGILQDNAIKLDRCRSRFSSLVTKTTVEKCTDFINNVREFRFIKIRNRQVNKFNTLMGNKDRKLTAQLLANNNQSQAQCNPNK